jgi:hypothetical protein
VIKGWARHWKDEKCINSFSWKMCNENTEEPRRNWEDNIKKITETGCEDVV